MCSIIALLLLVFGGFLGFSTLETRSVSVSAPPVIVEVQPTTEVAQLPTQAISCAAPTTQEDIDHMLAIVPGTAFEASIWSQQVNTQALKTTSTWSSNSLGAVAYLEYLHYDCGVSQAQIDAYYGPKGFAVLLSTYAPFKQTALCQSNGLKLFQFDGTLRGSDYHINYWVEQTSPTRVAGLMLVFPVAEQAQQADYAGRLFPDLPSCERAAG